MWSEIHRVAVGAIVSAQAVYALGHDWYAGRFDPEWTRPSGADIEATFARHGLTGGFWSVS